MDGYATEVAAPNLTFASMQARSDLETETLRGLDHGAGAPDGTSRPVKAGQEPVSRGFDLLSTE